MSDPIRIVIGTSANGEDAIAEMVTEYSIKKNCSRKVEIHWARSSLNGFWSIKKSASEEGNFETENWWTPWSGYRWAVAEYFGFEGKAIYLDVGAVNLSDISELWEIKNPEGCWFGAADNKTDVDISTSVMLIDCKEMKEKYPTLSIWGPMPKHCLDFNDMFVGTNKNLNYVVGQLPQEWLSAEGSDASGNSFEIEEMKQFSFLEHRIQPWKPSWYRGGFAEHQRKDLVELFWNLYEEAKENGYKEYFPKQLLEYETIGR
jgi:lipopolysaccharide biosynthesis glycosyltransferase